MRAARLDALAGRLGTRLSLPAAAGRNGRPIRPLLAGLALVAAAVGIGADAPEPAAAKRVSGLIALVPTVGGPAGATLTAAALGVAERQGHRSPREAEEYYRRTARKRVAPKTAWGFLPLYREAQRVYGVSWRLLASVHRQETAFSTASTTYHGLNAFGCCAGPMQFNVTNGPVSTWDRYRQSFRAGRRPARYPHRTKHHPSIYDDFDAIMAAGALLRDSGAGGSLDGAAWSAAYAYYGHDLYGITYASEVLGRAAGWQRDGFCPNCATDPSLVDEFDIAYGGGVRKEMLAEERKRKRAKARKQRAKRLRRERRERLERRERREEARRAERRSEAERRKGSAAGSKEPARRDRSEQAPAPQPPPPTDTTTTPAPPAAEPAPPPPPPCSGVKKLLGGC